MPFCLLSTASIAVHVRSPAPDAAPNRFVIVAGVAKDESGSARYQTLGSVKMALHAVPPDDLAAIAVGLISAHLLLLFRRQSSICVAVTCVELHHRATSENPPPRLNVPPTTPPTNIAALAPESLVRVAGIVPSEEIGVCSAAFPHTGGNALSHVEAKPRSRSAAVPMEPWYAEQNVIHRFFV